MLQTAAAHHRTRMQGRHTWLGLRRENNPNTQTDEWTNGRLCLRGVFSEELYVCVCVCVRTMNNFKNSVERAGRQIGEWADERAGRRGAGWPCWIMGSEWTSPGPCVRMTRGCRWVRRVWVGSEQCIYLLVRHCGRWWWWWWWWWCWWWWCELYLTYICLQSDQMRWGEVRWDVRRSLDTLCCRQSMM